MPLATFEGKIASIASTAAQEALHPVETRERQAIRLLVEAIKADPRLTNAALMTRAFEIGVTSMRAEFPLLHLDWWKNGNPGYTEIVAEFKDLASQDFGR